MYHYLLGALKRRVVLELKDSFAKHPIYDKIVQNIQAKYAFSDVPQFGIVVKGGSGNKVSLAADNFLGKIISHVMLANVGAPAYPIEWVREDQHAIEDNHGTFPINPGVYYLEVTQVPQNVSDPGLFSIDPLLTASEEPVRKFVSGIETTGQLENIPIKGTLRLYENAYYLLKEGVDYSVNYSDGGITFLVPFAPNSRVLANYQYATDSIENVSFYWNTSDNKTLPGVVMAFGKRARVGDKVAIVVYSDRVETAKAYGGKFEWTFDLDCIAQDPEQMEEISDHALMIFWALKKERLAGEGIEITDISMGGEAEEQRDENADIYYYTGSVSMTVRADWEMHIPMPLMVSRVEQTNTDTAMNSSKLFMSTVPIFAGRNNAYERIG